MRRRSRRSRALALALAGGVSASLLGASGAEAGSCPPDQVLGEARQPQWVDDVGIKRQTLSTVRLEGWRNVGDLLLRTRRLTIPVGGVIPTHQHDDRPSIVYILKGEVIEHNVHCAVPIVHPADEWTPEFGPGHIHWWENKGGEEVVILSSDVVSPDMLDDPDM